MSRSRHAALIARLVIPAVLLFPPRSAAGEHTPGRDVRAEARRLLAARFPATGSEGSPVKCGLPLLSEALRERALLSIEEASALASVQQREDLQMSILADSGRFRIHFDTTGANEPALLDASGQRIPGTARAYVDSAAAIMSHVYLEETVTLGFHPPPGDGQLGGGPEYDIYILGPGLGADTYGLTTPDSFGRNGDTSSTFIEIHNDFSFVSPAANRGIPSLRVTLAHEFHHAVQIGSYGFWSSDIWFHEITSTWMEDVVYHGENDYLNYLVSSDGQFRQPGLPLTHSVGLTMYSRGILGKYFAKKFGINTMLHIWQNIRRVAPLPAIDLTLHQLPAPTSLGIAFADWALWNYYTGPRADTVNYYDEARIFPVMAETYYDLISPTQQVTGSLSCLATAYTGYATGSDTVTVALVNMDPDCPAGSPGSSPYTLTVSKNRPDDTYRAVAGNLFLKLDVTNPSQWVTWTISRQGLSAASAGEGTAYPNPFHPGEGGLLYIPANADQGTLSIFSSGMELVYSGWAQTQSRLGQRVFSWDGRTSRNTLAPTGVYVFFLALPGRTVTGKCAVVRR